MTFNGWLQIVVYLVVLIALAKPLGSFMARVFEGKKTFLDPLLGPLERLIYRLGGVDPQAEMNWKVYAVAMLFLNGIGIVFLYILQRIQGVLPLNPQGFGSVDPAVAFNTAVSFVTNTNWQNYAGETTMSYLTQMLGLTVQNFLSAATGLAILAALIRGFARHSAQTIGNFWVDLTRSTIYILLPISVILAVFLVWQGDPQTFSAYPSVTLLQPSSYQQPKVDANGNPVMDASGKPVMESVPLTQQTIAIGPTASQIAIKHLGTNGGGFYNTNSAHPYESPSPLTDFVLIVTETMLGAGAAYAFGKMVGDTRQGWAILAAMMIIFTVLISVTYYSETQPNPALTAIGVDQGPSAMQGGGNMEGKEVRFGIARSAIFATGTTVTSTGAIDSQHDSFMPLGGLVLLVDMMLGENVLGGVGSGLYGMLIFVIVAVFVAGLMVGRTPEYLGKKIEIYEMKMASLLILIMPIIALGFTAVGVITSGGQAGPLNPGAHGFSEILYAFVSQANNNGSAFAGLTGNTLFYNLTGAVDMFIGRFWLAIPTLALAGSLARKKRIPAGAGTLPTHTPLFIGWLIGVLLLVGALNFVPALALGPVAEHLILFAH
jgi:K+-transporting ATPase ATPase A chain